MYKSKLSVIINVSTLSPSVSVNEPKNYLFFQITSALRFRKYLVNWHSWRLFFNTARSFARFPFIGSEHAASPTWRGSLRKKEENTRSSSLCASLSSLYSIRRIPSRRSCLEEMPVAYDLPNCSNLIRQSNSSGILWTWTVRIFSYFARLPFL